MYFVTGATGNVGREVVDLLLAEGAKVRALTRDPGAARLPAAAEAVRGDLRADPGECAAALDGVTAVFLNPAAVGEETAAFLALARERGVRRVVLLSSALVRDGAPPERQDGAIARTHKVVEDAVEASGLEWTHLRPGEFAANVFFRYGSQFRAGDVVRAPYGDASAAPIHERDIAAVAVRALLDDGHVGARYELTGPESLTQREKIRILGEVLDRPLRFEEITPEAGRQAAIANGLPAEVADVLLGYAAASVGRPAPITDTVPRLAGRPGLTFAQWAAEHADALRG